MSHTPHSAAADTAAPRAAGVHLAPEHSHATPDALARAAQVRLMIFDVDGVMTDGGLYYGAEGELFKRFNVMDGLGVKLLQQAGIEIALITARQSEIVLQRAASLGIGHVFQGSHNKLAVFEKLIAGLGLTAAQCGFMGDDIIDLPILTRVGFAAGVANCHASVRQRVHYIAANYGGNGAVREVCELVLHAQHKYEAALAPYLADTAAGCAGSMTGILPDTVPGTPATGSATAAARTSA